MIAVLTGDVVRSSRLAEGGRQAMLDRLERALVAMGGPAGPLGWQLFRGDAFQAALADPGQVLDEALRLLLTMLEPGVSDCPPVELRIGLGIGPLASGGPGEPIGRWSGAAFHAAGAALEALEGDAGRRLSLRSPWPELDAELEVGIALLDALRRRWSSEQRQAVLGALEGHSQARQAERLGVSQPAISKRLAGAGWEGLQALRTRAADRIAAGLDGHLFEEGDL